MKKNPAFFLIPIAYIAFISLGLPDGLHGVAWPGIRDTFSLPVDALGILLISSVSGYTLSSFFSSVLMRRLGVGGLLGISCSITSLSLLVYSFTPWWWLFVLIAAFGGLGAGAIDAGINGYVDRHYSERMMQWLHASFGIGVTLGPLIMTGAISLKGHWQPGYRIVGIAQAFLALAFFLSRKLWRSGGMEEKEEEKLRDAASMKETLGYFPAWLSMSLFFLYTGVELGLGLWAYTLLTESRGINHEAAGLITGSYWAMFTLGRVLAGWYSRRIKLQKILYISMFAAFSGILLVLLNLSALITLGGIGLCGFAIAPIFPGLVSDTAYRVGKRHQSNTIGMQIGAAGLGVAVIPSLAGVLARHFGLEIIPPSLAVSILLLILGFSFSRKRAG